MHHVDALPDPDPVPYLCWSSCWGTSARCLGGGRDGGSGRGRVVSGQLLGQLLQAVHQLIRLTGAQHNLTAENNLDIKSPAQPDSRKQPWHQEPSTTWQQKTTLTSRAQHNLTAENNLDIKSPAQPDSRKQPWHQEPSTTWLQEPRKQPWHQEPSTTWWWKTTLTSRAQHNLMVENNLDIKSPAQPDGWKKLGYQEPSTTW